MHQPTKSCFVLLGITGISLMAADLSDSKRPVGQGTPAHQAARQFKRGANLGNYLEAPPNQNWGASYSADDFVHIRAEGFDHVRLPIAWHHYTGPAPEYNLSEAIFAKADFLVTNALKNRLNVLLNLHHFDEFTSAPADHEKKFHAIWRQVAAHYSTATQGLAFELLNEPKDAATTLVMNRIYAAAIRQVRLTNPRRTIFVAPGKWNQASELANLRLPESDQNLIVTVHCYEPFYFTHQGAAWAGPDLKSLAGIVYPGPPPQPLVLGETSNLRPHVMDWLKRYNTLPAEANPCSRRAFLTPMKLAKDWSDREGRPVHVGEFGCYNKADPESRARFYREFRETLDGLSLGWAVWDWKAGFRYWEPSQNRPAPGMREALFPKGP